MNNKFNLLVISNFGLDVSFKTEKFCELSMNYSNFRKRIEDEVKLYIKNN